MAKDISPLKVAMLASTMLLAGCGGGDVAGPVAGPVDDLPTITAVVPSSGAIAGGTVITITGTGFEATPTVTVGGIAATGVTFVNSTQITATTPGGTLGATDVVVTNPSTGAATSTGGFTYEGNAEAAAINAYFADLPDWPTFNTTQTPDVPRANVFLVEETGPNKDLLDYRCSVTGRNIVRPFQEIASVGKHGDVIWPGAIVQGGTVTSGVVQRVNLGRSPITMSIDLAIDDQSVTIDEVNSVTAQQAVADLQLRADFRFGTPDPIRANIVFDLVEASTFEQSMLSMGVSGGYTDAYSGVGLGGSTEASFSRSRSTHTILVKMVQEMFTINFADDLIATPADFLAETVGTADLLAEEAAGRMGPDNLPVFVKSVTYGRVMMFSATSTQVESAEKLSAAMNASLMDYANASAELEAEQRQTLSTATYKIKVFGGGQADALAAIGALDWSLFFTAAPATTAVPIAYTVKTLKNDEPATIVDNVDYDQRGVCQAATQYSVSITLNRVDHTSGFCLACAVFSDVRRGGLSISFLGSGVIFPTTGFLTFNSNIIETLGPGVEFTLASEFDVAAVGSLFRYPDGAKPGNNMDLFINGANRGMTVIVNSIGANSLFTYTVRKTAQFPPG